MRSTILLLVIGLLYSQYGWAQRNPTTGAGAIQGTVLDGKTQETLPGVHVIVENTALGTVTDENGHFLIPDLTPGTYTLIFTYLGYAKYRQTDLSVSQNEVLDIENISLEEEAFALSQITVTPGAFSIMGNTLTSRQTLTEKDIKNMSWAEDITRAVARLPGVSSSDYSSKFTVRGGESDEVLINLDGMELYEPFHQRDFAGGLFSIVDIETIQSVDLLTGGFAADYGNRLSGVFNMRTKTVPDDQKHTSVGLSIMNARFYTDGRFADNKGSYIFSARRGMLDLVLKMINQDENLPIFYDAMGKVDYELSNKHILSLHVLHSGDKTEIRDIKENNFDRHDTKYGNTYSWLTLKSYYTPQLYSQTLLYGGLITHERIGWFEKEDYTDKGTFNLTDNRDYTFLGVKQDWNWELSNKLFLRGGFEARQLNATYAYHNAISDIRINPQDSLYQYNNTVDIDAKPSGQQAIFYLTSKFKVLPRLMAEAGFRYDYASYSDDQLWSPRLGLVYALGENTFLRGAWGYYYQTQFINNLDVNHNGTTFNPAELAKHYVLGFEHLFPNGLSLRVETYHKDISNLSPAYQNLRDPWEVFPESRNDVVKLNLAGASATGIEFFLKYDVGKQLSWWFSYALAKTEDDITSLEFDGLLTPRMGKAPRINDQPHTIYADIIYRPDEKWNLNLSWQFYKGWPRTNYTYEYQILPDDRLHFYQVHETFNGVRYPAYHRMDVRINRLFRMQNGRITTFLHLINVYNRENLRKYDLDVYDDNEQLIVDENGNYATADDHKFWFGFIPVFGGSWEF